MPEVLANARIAGEFVLNGATFFLLAVAISCTAQDFIKDQSDPESKETAITAWFIRLCVVAALCWWKWGV